MAIKMITLSTHQVGKLIGGIVHIAAKQYIIYLTINNHIRMLVNLTKMMTIRNLGMYIQLVGKMIG